MSSIMDRVKKRATAAQEGAAREVDIPLDKVRFDPGQPRKRYHVLDGRLAEKDQAWIETLAANIDRQGQIQAITVEELPDGTYIVRVGECRTRAMLLLGRKTIRAAVNNGLQKRSKRLLYQLSENIARDALEDYEVAETVRDLMQGDAEDPPMSQTEIAKELGFSDGWITRFVAFGDDELQKRWVHTGIADTAEKVYRLKLLPMADQLDILRRVDLPEDDPDHLAKPLKRAVIDDYARLAKLDKNRQKSAKSESGLAPEEGKPDAKDAIGLALAHAAQEGKGGGTESGAGMKAAVPAAGGKYQLDERARQKLLAESQGAVPPSIAKRAAAGEEIPPVNCRVTVSNLEALLPLLKTKPDVLKAVRSVRCEVLLPGEIARAIAGTLAGVVVGDQELAATVQNELSKLK